jgi:hypothetical protein
MGTAIYLLYVDLFVMLLLYVNPLLLLCKIFTMVLIILVFMYCMTMTYSRFCTHLSYGSMECNKYVCMHKKITQSQEDERTANFQNNVYMKSTQDNTQKRPTQLD